jgi:NADH dehydrogenase
MFGLGRTRLQPSYVEDVAEAIVRAFDERETVYELGGPRIYTYNELLLTIVGHLHIRRLLFPMPFSAWHMLAYVSERLPRPPITRNQVELMAIDSVACTARPGFSALGIEPRGIEAVLGGER